MCILWAEEKQGRILFLANSLGQTSPTNLRTHFSAGRRVWRERPWAWGMLSQPLSVPLILSSLTERSREALREGGKWGKEGGGRAEAGRRRREALSQRAGVTVGQRPPVLSSDFKIAVVSFVQHEKEPQQSAAWEVGGEGKWEKEKWRRRSRQHPRHRYSS